MRNASSPRPATSPHLEELAGAPLINLSADTHVARLSLGVPLNRMITANRARAR
jgi:hypothetical protein